MRRRFLLLFWLAAAGLLPAWAAAGSAADEPRPRPAEIIDAEKLAHDQIDYLVLDPRPFPMYRTAHLSYAMPIAVDALEKALLSTPVPEPESFIRALGKIPFRSKHPVVVYDTRRPQRLDGYVAWLLAYGGIPRVMVLDGSFTLWRQLGGGVHSGYPYPAGVRSLVAENLRPRPELRVAPSAIAAGPPPGSSLLEILPAQHEGGAEPGSGQARVGEFLAENGQFLFPRQLRDLLEIRGVEPDARILLRGTHADAGLAWVALVANGFQAALVQPLLERSEPSSSP
ncbi:MAG: rhodanese-like domain-containing protein [Acidobacteriota bacterium]